MNLKEKLLQIFNSAIKSVTPGKIFGREISYQNDILKIRNIVFNLKDIDKIYVIGFGKASSLMATELEKILIDRIFRGIVITKYGFKTPTKTIKVYESGHPISDENTILYSNEIIELLNLTKENDLVLVLISGGGSALFEIPDGFSLDELRQINSELLKSGADIHEINTLRKIISKIKGGRLLNYIYPSFCLSIVISDVIENCLSTIASGPTYISSEKRISATEILKKYSLHEKLSSDTISKILSREESLNIFPKEFYDYYEKKVKNIIIASNEDLILFAKSFAENLGYHTVILDNKMHGEAKIVASNSIKKIYNYLEENPQHDRVCFLAGGETTVTVRGSGKGGRNTEFVLSALYELIFKPKLISNYNFIIASLASDGNDGITDCAGAFVDYDIIKKSIEKNLNPKAFLINNDSYTFFSQVEGLIKTGPTYTNVMDIVIGLFEKKSK